MTFKIRNRVNKRISKLIKEGKYKTGIRTDKEFNKNMKALKLTCREFQAYMNNYSDARAISHCKKSTH